MISASLETLPSALTQMHFGLIKKMKRRTEKEIKKNGGAKEKARIKSVKSDQTYFIDSLQVLVLVNMERNKSEPLFRSKARKNFVTITIEPDNEKVREVVKAHFETQILPATMTRPPRPIFNQIMINDELIHSKSNKQKVEYPDESQPKKIKTG